MIEKVEIILRNGEDPKPIDECMFFDLFVEDLNLDLNINYPVKVEDLIEVTDTIFCNNDKISDIKKIIKDYPLNYNKLPQLWISKIDDIDLRPILKSHFDEVECDGILDLGDYFELCDLYDSELVYSVEGL